MNRPPIAIDLPVLRSMTAGDVDALHALSVAVNWPHRPDDWRFYRETGEGVVAADAGGRIMGSAMWWPFGDRLAAVGMVIVSPRLQGRGTGARMMRALFAAAGERSLRLVATAAGRHLYERRDFRASAAITQFQGIATAAAAADEDARVRPAAATDWPAIVALDAGACGGDRGRLLAGLARVGSVCVLEDGGAIRGYSACRSFGRGRVVGPVVAEGAAAAVALVRPHVRRHAGSFLRVDTPERGGVFVDFLQASGLRAVDRLAEMTRGAPPPPPCPGSAARFALAGQAVG